MANETGWQEYRNKWDPSQGQTVSASDFSDMEDGIQSEFVERAAMNPFNGVLSGMAPTPDDGNDEINVASGAAYIEGLKAVGDKNVPLSGLSADTYYLHIDSTETNEADAYKTKTTVPTQGELLLCRFDWNGTDTISNFVDLRQWGIVPGRIEFSDTGSISAATVFRTVFQYPVCIRYIQLIIDTCGTGGGPTLVDVHTGTAGSTATIWSDSGDRFSVAYDDTDGAVVAWNLADQNYKLSADDLLEIIVDQAATGASGLHMAITYTYY